MNVLHFMLDSLHFQGGMSNRKTNEYIQNQYQTLVQDMQKPDAKIIVQNCLYKGYAAALAREKTGASYAIAYQEDLPPLHTFSDPICAMKAMVDASSITVRSEDQKKQILESYTREQVVQFEADKQGLSILEAERRYDICIGNKVINPENILFLPFT